MFKRKTAGLTAVAAGMISVAACAVKLRKDIAPEGVFDDYYTYKPPFSAHELVMLSLSLMSLSLLVGGFILTAADGGSACGSAFGSAYGSAFGSACGAEK